EWGRRIARRLSETTQQAAAEGGAIFVPAGAVSASHHAWSADPWTRRFHLSLHNGAPYHPNAKGMAAVADLVVESLPPDLDCPALRGRPAPARHWSHEIRTGTGRGRGGGHRLGTRGAARPAGRGPHAGRPGAGRRSGRRDVRGFGG